MLIKNITILIVSCLLFLVPFDSFARDFDIGVYYFPGWHSRSHYWNDIKGLPGSKSPGIAWPNRVPLLGYYPEEETWVAETHIEWAAQFGIDFFAYDWYWNGILSEYEHALKSYLKAKNKNKLKFCLLWANHSDIPRNLKEFDVIVDYWIEKYFTQPTYYSIDGRRVIFVFDYVRLDKNAKKFNESGASLLARADRKVREKGLNGIYFVSTINDRPSDALETKLLANGYSAYTAWNYVVSKNPLPTADYDSMVDTYLDFYDSAARTQHKLPYMVPASPGWDKRPWKGDKPFIHVRENPTPQKFEKMLNGAKILLNSQQKGPKILMIEAWNEFGEGSYIEPTKEWGMQYLETIRKIFGPRTKH